MLVPVFDRLSTIEVSRPMRCPRNSHKNVPMELSALTFGSEFRSHSGETELVHLDLLTGTALGK